MFLIFAVFVSTSAAAERFDVDLQGTPLKESILSLGYRADVGIIVNGDLQGSVSINVQNKTIYEILDLLAMTHNFSYQLQDNTILVSPTTTMSNLVAYHIKHTDLNKAVQQLSLMLPKDKIYANINDNTITIDGSPAQHAKALAYLKGLDKPIQQIMIKAAFIELNRDKGLDAGFDFTFGNYTGGNISTLPYTITPSLQETKGLGKMLAKPAVISANGEEAKILMGDKVPVFTSTNTSTDNNTTGTNTVEYKDVGVTLKVTPRINDLEKGIVTLNLEPEVSVISKWITSGNNTAPQIATRTLKNQVRIRSGETLIIGGLFREEEIDNITAIPLLSKLPLLGNLFKHAKKDKRNTEIAIAITPVIINDVDGIPQLDIAQKSIEPKNNYVKFEYEKIKNEIEALKKELTKKDTSIKKLESEVMATSSSLEKATSDINKQAEVKQKIVTLETENKELSEKKEDLLIEKSILEQTLYLNIERDYETLKEAD